MTGPGGVPMPPWALPLILSPFVGSLLGVLAMRLPAGRPVGLARSECESCHRRLGVLDLVPIASYLALRGRCRSCGAPIGRAHLFAELGAVLVALGPALGQPDADPAFFLCAALLGWAALLLGWIDLVSMRLPDIITLPMLLLGLGATWWRMPDALGEHALAAALGFAGLSLVGLLYRRLRGRDGIGGGDPKLLAAGGAWLGLPLLPWMLFGGAVATLGLAILLRRRHAGDAVPFGPGLALALWMLFVCPGLATP